MSRRPLLVAFVVVAALAFLALACVPAGQVTRLVFVGDSLTVGIVGPFQTGVNNGLDYPEIVTFWVSGAAQVVNVAAGASTSTDWLPGGALFALTPEHADPCAVLSVLLGTNDLFTDVLDPVTFGANMNAIGQQALLDGYGGVLFLTTPKPLNATPEQIALLNGYRTALLGLCESNSQFLCADTFTEIDDRHYDPRDPSHPNQQGHGRLALGVFDAIDEFLVFPPPE